MSSCGYYSCNKGKPKCNHPTYGEMYSSCLHGALYNRCDSCRRECGGIYPSNIPKEDISNCKIDIIDKNGKYFINKDGQTNPIEIENLGALLQGVKEVTISGDKELKYQVIMDTVSKVKNAGVENLGINFYE